MFQVPIPYTAYCDSECMQVTLDEPYITPNGEKRTRKVTRHDVVGVCVKITSTDPAYYRKPTLFEGPRCITAVSFRNVFFLIPEC